MRQHGKAGRAAWCGLFSGFAAGSRYNRRMDRIEQRLAAEPEPLWTQDEAIAFEAAREAINAVMSICTRQIADEERKAEPDTTVINARESRLLTLHQERTALRVTDHAGIARVRKEYGAFVRAWKARPAPLAAK